MVMMTRKARTRTTSREPVMVTSGRSLRAHGQGEALHLLDAHAPAARQGGGFEIAGVPGSTAQLHLADGAGADLLHGHGRLAEQRVDRLRAGALGLEAAQLRGAEEAP